MNSFIMDNAIRSGDEDGSASEPIERWLSRRLGRVVLLTFTQNRSTMMSWRSSGAALKLRLHTFFTEAPEEIWECIALYLLTGDTHAGKVIDGYIEAHRPRSTRTPKQVSTRGRAHDLQVTFDALNDSYFHGGCTALVTWGKEPPRRRRRRRSITLGSYCQVENLIRIHPSLDQDFVPSYYVGSVLFHEMIHEVLGVEEVSGRRQVPPPEFVVLEEGYSDYVRAQAWQRANLGRLLAYEAP